MHGYQVDESIRTKVTLLAATLAIGLTWVFYVLTTNWSIKIPWWIEAPSVLGLFELLRWLYNNHLWNKQPFRKLAWFYIPDLSGKWNVTLKSSYKGFEETTKATALIRQTAVKMCITLTTDQSSSYSLYGIIDRVERSNTFELIYQYINSPNPESVETMNIHRGTTWVTISDDNQSMEGEYYSGRGRQHIGKISFARLNDKLTKSE